MPSVNESAAVTLFEEVQVVERWLNIEDLAWRIQALEQDELVEFHATVKELYRSSWVLMAAIVHELHRRTDYAHGGIREIASNVGVAETTAGRRSRVFRELLDEGKKAPAPQLLEESWYWLALSTPEPARWLEYADEQKALNPRYSLKMFRDDLGEHGVMPKVEPKARMPGCCQLQSDHQGPGHNHPH